MPDAVLLAALDDDASGLARSASSPLDTRKRVHTHCQVAREGRVRGAGCRPLTRLCNISTCFYGTNLTPSSGAHQIMTSGRTNGHHFRLRLESNEDQDAR